MDVSFDSGKDRANREKHGLPLSFGAKVLAGRRSEFLDTRRDYGEDRFVCFGRVEGRLYACVYTVRVHGTGRRHPPDLCPQGERTRGEALWMTLRTTTRTGATFPPSRWIMPPS
ncbi:BrnT family toxin [Jiella sonneratiae]|uniref:BrnT family toxin n=1 Tax=Jiella sonneratiae TaxID=2816856 RepID=A0ABS3J7N4_9HYPH|nr:BrnT family toxin [Jiella sonneratiae]